MTRSIHDDEAWIAVPKTENAILRFIANICGTIGGYLLDFSLKYGDTYEIDYHYLYGADTLPVDFEVENWMDEQIQEIFDDIDKS